MWYGYLRRTREEEYFCVTEGYSTKDACSEALQKEREARGWLHTFQGLLKWRAC